MSYNLCPISCQKKGKSSWTVWQLLYPSVWFFMHIDRKYYEKEIIYHRKVFCWEYTYSTLCYSLSRIHPVRIKVFWSKWKHSAVKPPSLVWRNSQMVPMKLEFKRQINPTGLGFYTLKFERLNSTSLAVHICLIIGDAVPGSNKKIHIFPLSPNAENLPKNVHHKCVGTNLVKHTYLWPWHCKYFIRSYWIDYYVFVFGQIFPPAPTLLYEHPQLLIGALVCWHYGEYIKLHESLLLYN